MAEETAGRWHLTATYRDPTLRAAAISGLRDLAGAKPPLPGSLLPPLVVLPNTEGQPIAWRILPPPPGFAPLSECAGALTALQIVSAIHSAAELLALTEGRDLVPLNLSAEAIFLSPNSLDFPPIVIPFAPGAEARKRLFPDEPTSPFPAGDRADQRDFARMLALAIPRAANDWERACLDHAITAISPKEAAPPTAERAREFLGRLRRQLDPHDAAFRAPEEWLATLRKRRRIRITALVMTMLIALLSLLYLHYLLLEGLQRTEEREAPVEAPDAH